MMLCDGIALNGCARAPASRLRPLTATPGNPPEAPKVTSLTDPLAAWTNKGQVKVGFAYGTNYLIDTRRPIILDVEATPARWTAEVAATKTVLERTQECFGLKPQRGWPLMPPMGQG
jgi:hypothetical protein